MTESSEFWSGILTGDAGPYSSDQMSEVLRRVAQTSDPDTGVFFGSGMAPDPGLSVVITSPASDAIRVTAGAAIVHGTYYKNTATVNFTITANTSGNPRIDTVILKKLWTTQTVRLDVVEGAPAVSPVPLGMVQSDGVEWQLPLADIAVANGFTVINTADITPRGAFVPSGDAVILRNIYNNSGGVLKYGDVVIWDTSMDRAVTTGTTFGDKLVAGVWQNYTGAGGYGRLMVRGISYVNASAAVTRGYILHKGTVAKQATAYADTPENSHLNLIGVALETTGGAGLVLATVNLHGRSLGASGFVIRNNGSDYTTSSGTLARIDSTNLTKDLVNVTGRIKANITGSFYLGAAGPTLSYLGFFVDGVAVATQQVKWAAIADARVVTLETILAVTPGLRTIAPAWMVDGGQTLHAFSDANAQLHFTVEEV